MTGVKWRGWTNPPLRRWLLVGVGLLVVGLVAHFVGGRPWDGAWLLLSCVAAAFMVIGFYRYPPER